ncbi:hypothetical protein DDZ14_02685 [Maritimibacter sp. 55A14]|uniref:hypothetical protein n=1 Tax=Maritimibacter sp. 55A14 TaxID=2174844 RepID=UPI000D614782|nr:hypothetical protein [Maritimibacter sp. 55A14]PWE34084.1 hypothetical protein DDZ14_02685 [Maritimibacter sp. 55A14]
MVDVLSDQANTFSFRAALGKYKAEVLRRAGLTISLLDDAPIPGANAETTASASKTSSVSFSDGRFVLMNDAGFRRIAQLAIKGLQPERGSTYFVVRDSIQAKGIEISLSAENELSLGGEGGVSKLFTAEPSIKLVRDEELIISSTFDEPLNVCIRAVRIDPVRPDGQQPQQVSENRNWTVTNISATSRQAAAIFQSN